MTRSKTKDSSDEKPTDEQDMTNKEQGKLPDGTPPPEGTPVPGTSNQLPPAPPALPAPGEKQPSETLNSSKTTSGTGTKAPAEVVEETDAEDKKKKGGRKKTLATAPKTPHSSIPANSPPI